MALTGFNAFSWPNVPLSRSAKDPSYVLLLAVATLIDSGDLESGIAQLNKLIVRVNALDAFYNGTYTQLKGSDRLSPYEMSRLIESLTKTENLFKSLANKKFISLLGIADDAMAFEIAALKNTILLQKLTLDLKNVDIANSSNPEKHRVLFENVNMNRLINTEQALRDSSLALSRLAYLELVR